MAQTELQPRLLDIPGAARYLGVRVYTIRDKIWSGQLPYLRLGKKFMLDRADLDAFVERRKVREKA
jgi:excisionase family DNA binding protein